MKQAILPLLSVALLLTAGSVMAQSDYGGSNQPADTTAASASATGSTAPEGSTRGTVEPAAPSQGSATGSAGTGSTYGDTGSTAAAAGGSHAHGSLPRTASDVPLVFVLGVFGAGALLVLRVYRIRNAH